VTFILLQIHRALEGALKIFETGVGVVDPFDLSSLKICGTFLAIASNQNNMRKSSWLSGYRVGQ
jgi:hypothetical protein